MEGIGYDFVPRVLDRSLVDQWYKCEDKTTMDMARRLITEEGILCGGSSGAAVHHALEYAKEHKLGKD
jgi:cystathionine beta-synthase